MIELVSKTLLNYYKNNNREYIIKFLHYNLDIMEDTPEEYKKIEQDLKTIYDYNPTSFLVYFSDVDNYSKFVKNINLDYSNNIYLRIRDVEEYNKLKSLNLDKYVKIIVDIKDINKLNIKDFDLVIQIDKVNELPILKLNELLKQYNIKELLVGQIPYYSKEYEFLYDILSKMYNVNPNNKEELEKINKITNDIYSVTEYINIVDKMNNIIKELDIDNEVDGIYKIYDYIANNVSYDYDSAKETQINNQNLIGSILNGKAVCEGISKYMYQMLSLINVESIIVQGGKEKENGGHVWNQVLVDGIWYNVDVTAYVDAIKYNTKVDTCLVKDSNLKYRTNSSISYVCNEDYRTKQL